MNALAMRCSVASHGARSIVDTRSKCSRVERRQDVIALAQSVDQMTFSGAKTQGKASIDLRTARAEVAKGLVHKYVLMVRQNARRVRAFARRRARRTREAIGDDATLARETPNAAVLSGDGDAIASCERDDGEPKGD